MKSQGLPYISSEESEVSPKQNIRGWGRRCGRLIRISLAWFDYIFLAVLSLLLIPAFLLAHVPFRIDFLGIAGAYWIPAASSCTFFAILLAVYGLPFERTFMPCLRRYRDQKARIVLALVFATWMAWLLGLWVGFIVTINTLVLMEFMERKKDAFEATLADIFWPGLYLFCGLILVYAYNHVIVSIRYVGSFDKTFRHLDWLLFHVDVSSIAQWGFIHLPEWFLKTLQFSYASLGAQIGSTLLFTAVLGGSSYAVRFVRTLLIGYAVALILFFALPAKGPYFLWPFYPSAHSYSLAIFAVQKLLGTKGRTLGAHILTPEAVVINWADYYISFPSMHVGLATIAIWFLRPWKRVCLLLLVFDVTLFVPAIILLEWHYVVDLIGGVMVAFLAIWISGRVSRRSCRGDLRPDPQRRVPVLVS